MIPLICFVSFCFQSALKCIHNQYACVTHVGEWELKLIRSRMCECVAALNEFTHTYLFFDRNSIINLIKAPLFMANNRTQA